MFDKCRYYDKMNVSYMRKILFICISGLIFYSLTPIKAVFSETEVGLRFDKYFTVGQRIEIAQEPAEPTEKKSHRPKKPLNNDAVAPSMEQKGSLPDKSGDDNGEEAYGPSEVPVLKKIEIDRIGAAAAYETFEGLRFGKYFTVSQRIEIFQEARPIDAYILDVKAIRILGKDEQILKWDKPVNFRSQIVPIFTRAYGTEITISDPKDKSGQLRYTVDYRDIYKQFYPKYPHLKVERWLQHEVLLMHSSKIPGIDWYYTSNLGYRFSNISVKTIQAPLSEWGIDDRVADAIRNTYFASLTLAPSARFEWFGKFEYFKAWHYRAPDAWGEGARYEPDHYLFRTEFRIKSADQRTSFIPSFSYSKDRYYPFRDTFEKYEMSLRAGRDFTSKLSGTSTLTYVLSLRDQPDNRAPTYARPNPYKDTASWIGVENRVSYNVWDKFYLQGGADLACGTNMSDFDNWATFMGIEYYNSGVLRANFGWNFNHYYNIEDTLSTIGFKIYILM